MTNKLAKKPTKKQNNSFKRIRFETFLKQFMGNPQSFTLSDHTVSEVPKGTDNNYVWTVLDVDGKRLIVEGWHYVNRDGYIISQTPHNGQSFEVFGVYESIEYTERPKLK